MYWIYPWLADGESVNDLIQIERAIDYEQPSNEFDETFKASNNHTTFQSPWLALGKRKRG